jgi:uncharacterized phage infection (PIP) family protein YhgE
LTRPIGERVASLEVEVKNLTEGVTDLTDTVKTGMDKLRQELQTQSLNGRTDRTKALVDDIGDPESRASLRSMIRNHDRRTWLTRPIVQGGGSILLVVLGALAGHYFG